MGDASVGSFPHSVPKEGNNDTRSLQGKSASLACITQALNRPAFISSYSPEREARALMVLSKGLPQIKHSASAGTVTDKGTGSQESTEFVL